MLAPAILTPLDFDPLSCGLPPAGAVTPLAPGLPAVSPPVSAGDPDEEEEVANDDLPVAEPGDEESNFDDFDDEFDDDFEEEESDPDWDHPDEDEPEPPPAKGGKKK
jgi:hypothetical protein